MRASDLPPSATFTDNNDGTGSFSYLPTYEEQGVYYTLFETIDSVDTLLRSWELVEITVVDSNRFPTVTVDPNLPSYTVDEGQALILRVIGV
ncbi:MAG: hypothetical protein GTN93_27040, partial [Anaerolineae bacterium]|nr:hypothetical protein [Anaerolineae bacterium]